MAATGICGSDVHGYTGENGRRFPGQVMGHESSGTIAAIGSGGGGLAVGTPVTFNPVVVPAEDAAAYAGREQHHPRKHVIGVAADIPAAFADYVVVPARNIVPLPDGLPIELGALIEPLAVAVHAVRRLPQESLGRVLVIGGGPIGQSIVIALRDAGAGTVIVSEMDAARRELVQRLGAETIDPAAGPVAEQLRERGGLADAALDAVGITPTLRDALTSTVLGAPICLVGMGAPQVALDAFLVSTEERSLIGSFTYGSEDFTDATEIIGAEPDVYRALISREIDVIDADSAFSALAAGDGTPGKVLVRFDREEQTR
ncbi:MULTISPECIES: zinc-binding dehydrogenase [unclassified Microbacterium]|uniref:zinc-dependent alcohol dehydrogenase n=1 Tax=unclassified Microbacterium TaxID=2609290 RepID=UPI001AEEF125|nr:MULTISPECIES: alcohol dehydrogenase catalytic domain-containing protein [unclassified Microbacterium]QYM64197.1 alcohol dehydrogenase catalytic domain-containing protein [Microbacterium sp. Se5.02b]